MVSKIENKDNDKTIWKNINDINDNIDENIEDNLSKHKINNKKIILKMKIY